MPADQFLRLTISEKGIPNPMIELTQTQSQPSTEQINVALQTQEEVLIATSVALHNTRRVVASWIPIANDAYWLRMYYSWIQILDDLISSVPSTTDHVAEAWAAQAVAISLTVQHHMRASA